MWAYDGWGVCCVTLVLDDEQCMVARNMLKEWGDNDKSVCLCTSRLRVMRSAWRWAVYGSELSAESFFKVLRVGSTIVLLELRKKSWLGSQNMKFVLIFYQSLKLSGPL